MPLQILNSGMLRSGRRTKRLAVELSTEESVNPSAVKYLNRLSDWFFVAGRVANNNGADDILRRCMVTFAGEDRAVLTHTPTFSMIPRFARSVGARVVNAENQGFGHALLAVVVLAIASVLTRGLLDQGVIAFIVSSRIRWLPSNKLLYYQPKQRVHDNFLFR